MIPGSPWVSMLDLIWMIWGYPHGLETQKLKLETFDVNPGWTICNKQLVLHKCSTAHFFFFSGEDLFSSWSPEKRGELKPMDNDHTNKKTHSEEAQYNRHSVETNDGCWLYFTSWKHWSSCVIFCCFRFLLRLYISKIVLVPFMFSPSTRQPHISN